MSLKYPSFSEISFILLTHESARNIEFDVEWLSLSKDVETGWFAVVRVRNHRVLSGQINDKFEYNLRSPDLRRRRKSPEN